MSEMVERVARAIQAFDGHASKDDIQPGYEAIARAAMSATHEPTEEMLIAAREWSYKKYGKPIGDDAARGCWQAMSDAAQGKP